MDYERVCMEVNLKNIAENVRAIRRRVAAEAKIMAVVKADGYGHGAVRVSQTALENGVDWLGVAICEEGVMLREAGVTCPILIMGYNPEPRMCDALQSDLIQTVYSYKTAEKLSKIAVQYKKAAQIHIKIDTGMNRIGYFPGEAEEEEIIRISQLPNIEITGIYSHLAASDADKEFSQHQYDLFMQMVEKLNTRGVNTGIRHLANSGGVMNLDNFDCDMVRTGIIMYGYAPSDGLEDNIGLKPAMSLKTHISHVKEIDAGASVGYWRSFFADKKLKMATIPVGYADGYSRLLGNRGRVLVNGAYARIIGNICMDQFMIDVSDIDNVCTDDEVVLIGQQGENSITVDEIAALQNTISYEIICCIGKRVPRVYKG